MQAARDRALRDTGAFEDPCPFCRKIQHVTRKSAKRHVRDYPGQHLSVYRCPAGTGTYHVGHLPEPVVRGIADRHDLFADTRQKCARRATMSGRN